MLLNELLRPFFDDTGSLRRYRVYNKLLVRYNGIYWWF
jgi:hypothetical protein